MRGAIPDRTREDAQQHHQGRQQEQDQALAEADVADVLGARLERIVHQSLVEPEHVPAGEDHSRAGPNRVDGMELEGAEHDRELTHKGVHPRHPQPRQRGHEEQCVEPGHSPLQAGKLRMSRVPVRCSTSPTVMKRAVMMVPSVDDLDHRTVDAVAGQREDAERDETEVADARVLRRYA